MTKFYYHATDRAFDRFDPDFQGSKGATNGYLGAWVGHERGECDMFGDYLMTLSIPEVVPYDLSYRELESMHEASRKMTKAEAADYYRGFARDRMAEGYTVIDIVSRRWELPSHSIIMDLDSIVIESCEFLERDKPSEWGKRW